MNDLRTAAQQALEAYDKHEPLAFEMEALRAALAEPVQQGCDHCNSPLYAAVKCRVCGRETPIIEPEIKGDNKPAAWIHTDPDKPRVRFLEWRENEPGYRGRWDKTPLYTAPPRCPNCASLEDQNTELDRKLAEMERKPLTEEEIDGLMQSIGLRCADDGNERMANHAEWERRQRRRIARAVERAHRIE